MKNHVFLSLLAGSIIFSSCSNDDETEDITSDKKLLLSKITTTYYDNPSNPEIVISTLTYNDKNQVTGSESDGSSAVFEYDSNGKPTKTNYYKPDKTLEYSSLYTYNGEQLTSIKAVYSNPLFNRSVSYSYDSNGRVTKSSFCESENCSNPSRNTYLYNGDNVSVETVVMTGTISYTYKTESSYDDKPNPYTNINKYLKIMMGGADVLSKNNYISGKISYKNADGTWSQSQSVIYTIQYNDANYPIQIIGKESNGNISVKYNYEYIIK
ncbi:hypothetical protein [Epilithonimonas mollis]|uniref:DUF4595 domain-containing protein n=1 Tax=Epilithonimonas mollis TaxID=216903 RepID=A0A1M6SH21_9FLAO|nr:hypothetical protein [Epilithonimonas mollis]SHK43959.1 hypothetical protein SAMN05444371_2456 [Epilithonimonas mollis]